MTEKQIIEASEEWAKENYGINYMDFSFTQDAAFRAMYHFRAGAKWQKEQMMKEAVEGKIIYLLNGDVAVNIGDTDEYNLGDKVKIIIVKED